jgi:uncharacterized protein
MGVYIDEFEHGRALFNQRRFYDAHEVWEDIWRAAPVPEKKFLQGLIQLAVGFHHHSTGNAVGARSLLRRGSRNLALYPAEHGALSVQQLLEDVAEWLAALEEGRALPPHPSLQKSAPDSSSKFQP